MFGMDRFWSPWEASWRPQNLPKWIKITPKIDPDRVYETSSHLTLSLNRFCFDFYSHKVVWGVLEPITKVAIPPDQPPCRSLRSDANFTRVTASCLRSFRHQKPTYRHRLACRRYRSGSPTQAKPLVVFLSGAIPMRFFSHGGRGKGEGWVAVHPASQPPRFWRPSLDQV